MQHKAKSSKFVWKDAYLIKFEIETLFSKSIIIKLVMKRQNLSTILISRNKNGGINLKQSSKDIEFPRFK